ncbi:MAG: hypothetical protein ACMXYA_00340, partial [Candidatus Woesearchaeota archaeon]
KAVKKVAQKKSASKKSRSPAKKKSQETVVLSGDISDEQIPEFNDVDLDDIPPPPSFGEELQELDVPKPAYSQDTQQTDMDEEVPEKPRDVLTEPSDSQLPIKQDISNDDADLSKLAGPFENQEEKPSFLKRLFGKKTKKDTTPSDELGSSKVSGDEQSQNAMEDVKPQGEKPEFPLGESGDLAKQDAKTLEDVAQSEANDVHTQDIKSDSQNIDEVHKRQEEYVANLRRRLDSEMREREEHLKSMESELQDKESELEQKHNDILAKEEKVVKLEQEAQELEKLKEELENKEISLQHKDEELAQKETELNQKAEELERKESELIELEKDLQLQKEELEHQKPVELQVSDHVEDDEDKIKEKYALSAHEPKKIEEKPSIRTVQNPSKQSILESLQDAYSALHKMDIPLAKKHYVQISNDYRTFVSEHGSDAELHQDIVDLYNDIKLAMVHQ